MAVDIGPKIGIDGEKEFREQLNSINQDLRTLNSQMKAVTSSFDAGDDSQEALTEQTAVLNEQIEKQQKKLELLRKGMNDAAEVTGENSKQTKRWEQGVYDATAELNRMKKQLDETERGMGDVSDATEDAADQMDDMEDAAGGLKEKLKDIFVGGAIVGGVKELVSGMVSLVDETAEYRRIMASLENSSTAAGYSAEETAKTYQTLIGVLGDTQSAATTTANLQAIGLSVDDLAKVTDGAIGAWARYGDSIPIDGLAESINETIQAGQVTGNFADVLNWAGVNEDDFNKALAESSDKSERANLVLKLLTEEGLTESGQKWLENNQSMVENQQATDRLNESTAALGATLEPFVTLLKDGAATLVDWANTAIQAWVQAFTQDIPNGLKDGYKAFVGLFGDIKTEVEKLPGEIKEVGKNVITGLWDGVKEKSAWLKGKISGLISEIKSAFTGSSGFDIHSPSKWARKQFAYVMEGAGEGFSDGLPYAMTSADNAVAALQSRMTMSVATPEVSANNAAAGIVNGLIASTGGSNGNQPVTIVLQTDNGAEIARWLLPDIRAAQRANPEVVSGV
nr:MAG TPA: minor tail protein [Caudoviricetes sp.]